jgi:NADH-quinone oxidoreductase subunit L
MHHEQDMRRMGGLRKYMPYTYLTFLAGWLAICGVIPFSGFWSKDEILWRTAATNHIPIGWLLWIVGTIAATCTAFYMTRLVAMTFWGKEKFGSHEHTPGHEAHEDHPTPGHQAHTPHESPKSMWVPLVVLAILATIGGFIGISTAFTGGKEVGGKLNIVTWLSPVVWNPSTKAFGAEAEAAPAEAKRNGAPINLERQTEGGLPYGDTGFNLAHAVESKVGSETVTEWVFIIISLIVAVTGIGLGLLFYIKDTRLPDVWAVRLAPLYRASYHKYWIDEFYGWAFTRRTMDLARGVFNFDSKVVDGAVNGSAWLTRLSSRLTGNTDKYLVDGLVNGIANFIVRLMSPIVRAAQTGLTANYALVMVIGLLVAVAFYLVKIF